MNPGDVDWPYALRCVVPQVVPRGTSLAHGHPFDPATGQWPCTAFNAASRARFAAHQAEPTRSAWYAGTTPACALWETHLRFVRPTADGVVLLSRSSAHRGRILSHVLTTRELHVLPLVPTLLHGMHGRGEAGTNAWTQLLASDDYDATHKVAAYLLQRTAELGLSIDGFVWHSKQCASLDHHPLVYLLFSPPCRPEDFTPDPERPEIALDDGDAGWTTIADALSIAGLRLADADTIEDDAELAAASDLEITSAAGEPEENPE